MQTNNTHIKSASRAHNLSKPIRLPTNRILSPSERKQLRKANLTLFKLGQLAPEILAELTGIPLLRAQELVALVRLQALSSVGPQTALDLLLLGCHGPEDLNGKDPVTLVEELQKLYGVNLDPCVEDVFRCAIAQASFADLPKWQCNWWAWKCQRGQSRVSFLPAAT